MSTDGIDQKTGKVNVYKLCPEMGDSIMIVNCGDHFEIRHHHWEVAPLFLTEQEVELLKAGRITWN